MSAKRTLSLYGLKWNPFSPELPNEGLLVTPRIENFAWRVEQLVQEGGFALITGESGTVKSVALRIVVGFSQKESAKSQNFFAFTKRLDYNCKLNSKHNLCGNESF